MVLIAPRVGIYLPNLADDADLEQANGAFQVAYASASLIGMGGSAYFILSHRFAAGFLLDAGSYVTAMATIVAIGPLVSMGQNVDQEGEQGLVPVGLLGIGRWLLRLFDARRELLAMVVINGAVLRRRCRGRVVTAPFSTAVAFRFFVFLGHGCGWSC